MQAFVVMRLILVEVSSRMNTNKSRGRPVSTLLAYYQLVPPLQGNDWTSCRYPRAARSDVPSLRSALG